MKHKIIFIIMAVLLMVTTSVWAADKLLSFSIDEAMNDPKVQNALLKEVKLFWGEQGHSKTIKNFGEFKTSKRTNALGKSKEAACRWALATSLVVMQKRALKEGGNAVVNIRSNVLNHEKSSTTEYDCLAGGMMVNSAIKGNVVKLK